MDGTVGASAIIPSHSSMDIVASPPIDVDPAPISVPIQMQASFWTSCGNCGMAFEYGTEYLHCLLRCPHCQKTFEAKERSLKSIIGSQTDRSVPHAPNVEVPAKSMEDIPCTQRSNVPKRIQHESGHGVSMRGDLLDTKNGFIMQARHKRQTEDLSEPFGTGYKVQSFLLILFPFSLYINVIYGSFILY